MPLMTRKMDAVCSKLSELCECSDMDHRHSSCLFSGGKILESGFNYNTRSRMKGFNLPSMHAEMSAITKYIAKTGININFSTSAPTERVVSTPRSKIAGAASSCDKMYREILRGDKGSFVLRNRDKEEYLQEHL